MHTQRKNLQPIEAIDILINMDHRHALGLSFTQLVAIYNFKIMTSMSAVESI